MHGENTQILPMSNKFKITPSATVGELHPLFKALQWVAQARSTDESRLIINHIQVKRDDESGSYTIAATDGKRLHVADFDPGLFDSDFDALESGLYEVIAKGSKFLVLAANDEAGDFPNWLAITGDFQGFYESHVNPQTVSHVCIKTGVILAPDYLDEAIGFGTAFKKGETVSLRFGPITKGKQAGPMKISHEIGKAYIMPLKEPETSGSVDDGKE